MSLDVAKTVNDNVAQYLNSNENKGLITKKNKNLIKFAQIINNSKQDINQCLEFFTTCADQLFARQNALRKDDEVVKAALTADGNLLGDMPNEIILDPDMQKAAEQGGCKHLSMILARTPRITP